MSAETRARFAILVASVAAVGSATPAAVAQDASGTGYPAAPARWWSLAGEVSGTVAPEDHGFFNDTSYENNALRLARFSLSAALRPRARVSLLAEVRSDNADEPRAYALFVRARPSARLPLDVQAGLVPPVFGAYPRQRYARDSPFVATPLAYQYLTTLRPDAVPGHANDLLRVRGSGWLLRFPLGQREAAPGLPIVDGLRYDTGVQARYGGGTVEALASLTRGSLSRPRVRDDNDGLAFSSRLAWRPRPSLALGLSQSRGEWLSRDAQAVLAPLGRASAHQTAWGADLEASAGYWLVRGEAVWSAWSGLPVGPAASFTTVRALALTTEGRYRFAAGLNAGARAEHVGFSSITGTAGSQAWEAPVTRLEVGLSYAPVRHLTVKAGYQRNWRSGGRVRRSGLWAAQVLAWF
jgi:hypothetical protein